MSYARVETSVRTNRKFIKAGPAPSWLWLCGVLYCQDALTDGFIAEETLEYLGVKNALRLVGHLERAGLWEKADGGWRIHDYLKHNKTAAEIQRITQERRDGGKKGGRKPPATQQGKPSRLTSPETFPVYVDVAASVAASVLREEGPGETIHLDVAFESFKASYPGERKYFGSLVNKLFIDAIQSGKTTPQKILAALENHKASAQWQEPSKIPGPEKWLEQERWDATMSPPKSVGANQKTAGTLEALQRFAAKGGVQ